MGIDIRMYHEFQDENGIWQLADPEPSYAFGRHTQGLLGLLGQGTESIWKEMGLPDDCSVGLSEAENPDGWNPNWQNEGYGRSWLSLADLNTYEWESDDMADPDFIAILMKMRTLAKGSPQSVRIIMFFY